MKFGPIRITREKKQVSKYYEAQNGLVKLPEGWNHSQGKVAAISQENANIIMGSGLTENKEGYNFGLRIKEVAKGRITEGDLAIAQTTIVLGQYAPQFGWPDDWALYWEYLDARLLVPEVAFAIKLKKNLIWKTGYEIVTKDEALKERFKYIWEKCRMERVFKSLTEDALTFGNGYAESVDNSIADWSTPFIPNAGALGADQGTDYTNLVKFTEATEFYGLKKLDPRTMRVQVDPANFDTRNATIAVQKYIHRVWTGPLAPQRSSTNTIASSEISLHPKQCYHLKFNTVVGGIYGYSMIREGFYTAKAYCMMMQYLPAIVQKRADVRLHFKYGGEVKHDGQIDTVLSPRNGFDAWIARTSAVAPTEDLYTDILTDIQQIYKSDGPLRGLNELIQVWKERLLIALGIPTALLDPQGNNTQEIKWGGLKFEILENEIRECQQTVEDLINEQFMPHWVGGDAKFRFNPITPEDWRANVAPLLELYNSRVISKEYVLERLQMPTSAGEGTMFEDVKKQIRVDDTETGEDQSLERFEVTHQGGKTIVTQHREHCSCGKCG